MVVVDAITESEVEIIEGIELIETFDTDVPLSDKCFPFGEYREFGLLVLERRQRICGWIDLGDGLKLQWYWDDWTNYKEYEFDKENQPYNNWRYQTLPTKDAVRDGYGKRVFFPSRLIPAFEINWTQLHCEQELSEFILDYAASWLESTPTYPAGSASHQCGLDTVVSEQRRILYYPLGEDQVNRYGSTVGPIEVQFEENPLEAFTRHNNNYGGYEGVIRLIAVHALPHAIIDELEAADYLHSDTEATERERVYQGTVSWGDGGETDL